MSLLLTKEQVTAAMSLDIAGMRKALDEGGYYDNYSMDNVEFEGMNMSGLFVYSFVCDDGSSEDGEPYSVRVYVTYKRRQLSKEVYLQAEY